jgi:hypothetical protein
MEILPGEALNARPANDSRMVTQFISGVYGSSRTGFSLSGFGFPVLKKKATD